MTTSQPASPEPQATPIHFDYEAWLAEDAKRRAAFAEALIGLKANLFDALEASGILLVTVTFDGCGDSGQIEDISAVDEHGAVDLAGIALPQPDCQSGDSSESDAPGQITDAIETLAYDLLESEHGGWEINEGAFGEFRFDVADRTITLGCHMRIETTDFTETCW